MSSEPAQWTNAQREFAFTDADFDYIRRIVAEQVGISLADHKRQLVYGRLSRRLRALRLPSFGDYCRLLEEDGSSEIGNLVNAITTNVTSFYREAHHFELLGGTLIPERLSQKADRLRIWSAGCSSGEEPYSIAITVAEALGSARIDGKILATDIDANCLAQAKNGVYSQDDIEKVSPAQRRRWFQKGSGSQTGKARVKDDLKRLITFNSLNLMHPWPMNGPFDAIFCRNVVIYFDKDTKAKLVSRFADLLRTGGYLFLGHSESLHGVSQRFRLAGRTAYKKER